MMKVVPPLYVERKVERSRCYPYQHRCSSARPNRGAFFQHAGSFLGQHM